MASPRRLAARAPLALAALALAGSGFAFASSLAPASATTSGSSPYAGRIGLNSHVVWLSQADAQPQLERARAGGVDWIREEFPWRVLEPSKGTFDWRNTDALMAASANAGVNVLAILAYSAKWASSDPSGGGDSKYPPRDVNDYADYAVAVVRRYGPGGAFWAERPDLTPRPVTAVELWNEPWGYWAWKPNPDPVRYAALARAAAAAIKQHDPSIRVLVPGDVLQVRTDGTIREWQRELLAADPGLSALFDLYSVHPYPHPRQHGPYYDRADPRWDYRRVELTRSTDPSKPIWITEIGWSTASDASETVSEAEQAEYVHGAIERALGSWGAYVERVFPYQWDKDGGSTSDRERYYGLRRADDSAKPAWDAVVALLSAPPPTTTETATTDTATTATATTETATTTTETATTTTETATTATTTTSTTTTTTTTTRGKQPPRRKAGNLAVGYRYPELGPKRLPRWFWGWASWRLGGADARPAAAPRTVPAWAWRRLASRTSASYPVVLSGRVLGTGAQRRPVVVRRLSGETWKTVASTRTAQGGTFRFALRLPSGEPSLLRVALPDGAATSRQLRVTAPR